ncbi:MAG: MipA/OmpV family protein [Rubrivivax sp.]|nr:MipA/OmpV family protein [Rubrivivax sp.]
MTAAGPVKRFVLGLLLAAMATGALADEPLWEAGFGAGWLRLPHYRGSDESHAWLLPVPYFVYRGKVLRADKDGARAVLFDGERVDFDLSVGGSPPTKSRDNRARAGMPDLAPSFEIGPKLNLRLAQGPGWKVDLRVPVRAVVTIESRARVLGWNIEPLINAGFELGGLNVGLQAGPLWGDRRLHQHLYGVAPLYATVDRPAYAARAGYGGWQATAGLSRRFDRLWLGAFVRHDSVARAAFEASPLVKSRHTTALGVAMSWVFATSEARVPDPR